MKRNIIIIIAIIVLIGIAVGAIFFLQNDSSEDDTGTSQAEQSGSVQSEVFNVAATSGSAFVATMNGTTTDGTTYTATIQYDGNQNSYYVGTFQDEQFELYALEQRFITCSQGQCIESPVASSGIPISSDQYEYSEEDVNAYREGALFLGNQNCPAGTCKVWGIEREGYSGKLFVDSSGRISRAEWNGAEGSFSIDYEYRDVIITPPENVLTIPNV